MPHGSKAVALWLATMESARWEANGTSGDRCTQEDGGRTAFGCSGRVNVERKLRKALVPAIISSSASAMPISVLLLMAKQNALSSACNRDVSTRGNSQPTARGPGAPLLPKKTFASAYQMVMSSRHGGR